MTFDYPSIQALAGFIAVQQQPQGAGVLLPHQASSAQGLEEAHSAVLARLLEIASGLLGGAEVAPDQPLMEAGLDSIGAVELRNAVQVQHCRRGCCSLHSALQQDSVSLCLWAHLSHSPSISLPPLRAE